MSSLAVMLVKTGEVRVAMALLTVRVIEEREIETSWRQACFLWGVQTRNCLFLAFFYRWQHRWWACPGWGRWGSWVRLPLPCPSSPTAQPQPPSSSPPPSPPMETSAATPSPAEAASPRPPPPAPQSPATAAPVSGPLMDPSSSLPAVLVPVIPVKPDGGLNYKTGGYCTRNRTLLMQICCHSKAEASVSSLGVWSSFFSLRPFRTLPSGVGAVQYIQ